MKFTSGQEVWVIERDEMDEAYDVSGYIFITEVMGVAIVHPFLGDCGEIDEILDHMLEETREIYGCEVMAYPIVDCYETLKAAESALEDE